MHKTLYTAMLVSVLSATLVAPAWSASLMDSIKSQAAQSLGGSESSSQSASGIGGMMGSAGGVGSALGLPSLSGDTAGNAAGVLEYCIKNKYLGTDASSVKDNLLSKAGLGNAQKQQEDAGYQQGLGGMLSGRDGASFDLNKVKSDLKDKACGYVLDHASSLL